MANAHLPKPGLRSPAVMEGNCPCPSPFLTHKPKGNAKRFSEWFVRASSFVLLVTAVAKMVTVWNPVPYLLQSDSVFPFLTVGQVIESATLLELTTVVVVLLTPNLRAKLIAIGWLGLLFLAYRACLNLESPGKPSCPCLGTVGQIFGISDPVLDKFMFAVAAIFFLGSVIGLKRLRMSHYA